MAKLDACPEIISMALALKLDARQPVEEILGYCRDRILGWVKKAGGARTIDKVEEIVCRNLNLELIEVWSDDEVAAVSEKYVAEGEIVFASLAMQLDAKTFATVMRRENPPKRGDHYIAVIDCRGSKAARRFFTRWHEIAHLLVDVTQLELPFQRFRTRDPGDPEERLMDVIAGEVGFHPPLFDPALMAEIKTDGRLTFDGVERIRSSICSNASFQASLIACAKRSPTPAIYVEAEMGLKKSERQLLDSRQMTMFGGPKPQQRLRAILAVPNAAAKKKRFLIHPNMRIPEASLITIHRQQNLESETTQGVAGVEEFSIWQDSDGTTCGDGPIHVQVRKIVGTVLAVIQPA